MTLLIYVQGPQGWLGLWAANLAQKPDHTNHNIAKVAWQRLVSSKKTHAILKTGFWHTIPSWIFLYLISKIIYGMENRCYQPKFSKFYISSIKTRITHKWYQVYTWRYDYKKKNRNNNKKPKEKWTIWASYKLSSHTSSLNNVNKIILQNDQNWTRNDPNTQNLSTFLNFDFLIIVAHYSIFYILEICPFTRFWLLSLGRTDKLSNSRRVHH